MTPQDRRIAALARRGHDAATIARICRLSVDAVRRRLAEMGSAT